MIIVSSNGENINVSCDILGKEKDFLFTKEIYDNLVDTANKAESINSMDELSKLWESIEKVEEEASEEFAKELGFYKSNKDGNYYAILEGDVVSSIPVPQLLVDRIEYSVEKGIDVDPLRKFWLRLLRSNKRKDANFMKMVLGYISSKFVLNDKRDKFIEEGYNEAKATEMAEVYEVKLTKEGLLSCFKVATEVCGALSVDDEGNTVERTALKRTFDPNTGEIVGDNLDDISNEERLFLPPIYGTGGDAFYCGETKGHHIRIGQRIRLESWDQVDLRDGVGCVKGLHVGGLQYIKNLSGEILNCFVDPMNIGAIATDDPVYGPVMRVKEYFTFGALKGVNTSIYHSSTYANENDDAWSDIQDELKKKVGVKIEALEKQLAELKSL